MIEKEIRSLIDQNIIIEVPWSNSLVLSPIFLVEKSSGGHRLILNLKKFNASVPYLHFKMETFEHALTLVSPNIYMASLDIKNAYYSIPVHEDYQKYLSFQFEGRFYSFTCVPNGLSTGPFVFTRIMKPILSHMRQQGFKISSFIDDSFLLGETRQTCKQNVNTAESLLLDLGFSINYIKSVKDPSQRLLHLGNIIDSVLMIVELPEKRISVIIRECKILISAKFASIRVVARIIGLIVATFSAVELGKLHYRKLERRKVHALLKARGNFNKRMKIDQSMKSELIWWIKNLPYQYRVIQRPQPEVTITTDSSTIGWGCEFNEVTFNGKWTRSESKLHINSLELLAVLFSLKALISELSNKNVLVLTDSTTTVSYITNMGGLKSVICDRIARDIWNLCIHHNIWLTSSHVPGIENVADEASRVFQDRHEWGIDKNSFHKLCDIWGTPDIDLFATRLNRKLQKFCSWRPDPEASYIDAFTLRWNTFDYCYIFPPFSLISRILQKIEMERSEALIIAPLWPTQIWWPRMMMLVVDHPVILSEAVLTKAPEGLRHPMASKMALIGARVSGQDWKPREYRRQLPNSSLDHGVVQQPNNIKYIFKNGFNTVAGGKLIHLTPI